MIQPQADLRESTIPENLSFLTASSDPSAWRNLYLQAIFERNRAKIPERIREAEKALMHREHELCALGRGWTAERESVIAALHCLEALGSCMEIPIRGRVRQYP